MVYCSHQTSLTSTINICNCSISVYHVEIAHVTQLKHNNAISYSMLFSDAIGSQWCTDNQ